MGFIVGFLISWFIGYVCGYGRGHWAGSRETESRWIKTAMGGWPKPGAETGAAETKP